MERMSTLDAGFFFVEHDNVPMHIGSLAVFDGPAPSRQELSGCSRRSCRWCPGTARWCGPRRSRSSARCGRTTSTSDQAARAARDRAGPGRAGASSASWREDLRPPLDRARPLWEAWLLDGLKGGRWAILSKVHHCMVDGVGGNDLMTAIFDADPDAERAPARPLGAGAEPAHA